MKHKSLYFRRKEFQHKLNHLRWHWFKESAKTFLLTVFCGITAYMIFVVLLLFG